MVWFTYRTIRNIIQANRLHPRVGVVYDADYSQIKTMPIILKDSILRLTIIIRMLHTISRTLTPEELLLTTQAQV